MIDSFIGEYRFLSNFWMCSINTPLGSGIVYPSVEHAYQAFKTWDSVIRKEIRQLKTPSQAKRFGKKIKLRVDWEEVKLQVMYDLVYIKFYDHLDLREKLLRTDNQNLIEGNTWGDTYWGMCNGVGENHLGRILMNVREKLRGTY